MSKIVPRGAGEARLISVTREEREALDSYNRLRSRELYEAIVTKPVTNLGDVTKPKSGRPPKFGKAMSPAERKRLQRQRLSANQTAA